MRILLSNDDGYDAPGLQALIEGMERDHEVWVVAPDSEQSAQSHSLTMHHPLRVRQRGEHRFAVSGTPADSMYLAMHGLLPERPDLVVSGINRGSNLGGDVHYSGTVAAAREATMAGMSAIAVSLHIDVEVGPKHWDTAVDVARRVVARVAREGLPTDTLLNVNVPDVPTWELKGLRSAKLGHRRYANKVHRREDPWGRPYYWIGGGHLEFAQRDGTDGPYIEQGWATVTPLHSDPTYDTFLEQLGGWFDA